MLEDVLKDIVTVLKNDLPGMLTQVYNERGAPALEEPRDYLTTDQEEPRRLPAVTVDDAGPTDTRNETGRRREFRHHIIIYITHENAADLAQLKTDSRRYVEAVERALGAKPDLGDPGRIIKMEITRHDYGETFQKEGQPFMRVPTILLDVWERYKP